MLRKLYNSKNFYLNNSLYIVLSVAGAVLSYAIYPIMVRILSKESFGDFTVALAVSSQMASVFLAFNVVSLHITKKHDDGVTILSYLQSKIIRIFLLFSLFVLITSPIIKTTLKLDSYLPLLATLLLMLLSIPAVIWLGFLQANKEMTRVGLYTFVTAFLKLIFAVVLALILQSSAAMFGVVVAQLIGVYVLSILPGKKTPPINFFNRSSTVFKDSKYAGLYKYLVSAILVTLMLSFAQNADTLLGKSLLSRDAAGSFVAVSSLSNVVYYTGFLLVWVVLSNLSMTDNKQNKKLLYRAFSLLIFMGIIASFIALIFEYFGLNILLGSKTAYFAGQLPREILYQSIMVVVTLYFYWRLTIRSKWVVVDSLIYMSPLLIMIARMGNTNYPIALMNTILISQLLGIILVALAVITRNVVFRLYETSEKN